MKRSIEHIIPPPPPHMVGDGFRVHSFFPGGRLIDQKRMSPFFMLDYGSKVDFGPSAQPRGVGVHPHAGFETVTIAYQGRIAHHDSAGNSGIIGAGDVQWMTAGSGVLHKEYHEESFSRTGGPFQMVQLWVNLPAVYKRTPPKYQEIAQQQMGQVLLGNDTGLIEVIAGSFAGVKGPASTFTPIEVYNVRLRAGGGTDLSLPSQYNTGMLVVEGSVMLNDRPVPVDHFALFANDGETVRIKASVDSVVLVLSGEPIDEPIAAYGPFVMNTWDEVEQAIRDVHAGKYGLLED